MTAVLVVGALGALGGREPLSFADSFRDPPPSIEAQAVIAEHFIPGRVAPVGVVTDFDAASGVVSALSADPRMPIEEMYLSARSVPAPGREDLALSEAYLSLDPFSQAATDSVPAIRAAARARGRGERRRSSAARSPRPTTRSRRSRATRG